MKNNFKIYISLFCIAFFITINVGAQSSLFMLKHKLKKANKFEEKGDYIKARNIYSNLIKNDSVNAKINFGLGMNYHFYSSDKRNCALNYLHNALKYSPKDSLSDYLYYYSESEHFNENFRTALGGYRKFANDIKIHPDDYLIEEADIAKKINESELGIFYQAQQKNIIIKPLSKNINTADAEYAPNIFRKDSSILFCSRKPINTGKKRDVKDNKFYEDIFLSVKYIDSKATNKLFEKSKFANIVNQKFHDAIVWKSENDSIIISYKNNKLYKSNLVNGIYSAPNEFLPDFNKDGWTPHASIDLKRNIVYFSSCSDANNCNLDIYKGKLNLDGSVTDIKPLNSLVNSSYNEDSPNYNEFSNSLFFSSQNNSIGGYDIFEAKLDSVGDANQVVSLGMPINSPGDDIFYIKDIPGNIAYFSSFRIGGQGDLDIYYYNVFDQTCEPYTNNQYEVVLNAESSLDPRGAKAIYIWQFDDNTIETGIKISHIFKRPGKHKVTLNVKDSITSRIEYNEKEIEVNIENVNYFEIHSADTVIVNQPTKLSSDYCMLKNDTIKTVDWNTGDGSELNGYDVNYIYKMPGIYCQNITLKTNQNKQYTTAKKVIVVTKDEYEQLAKVNAQRADSTLKANNIAINFSNDSLGTAASNVNGSDVNFQSALVFFDFDKSFIRKEDYVKLNKFSTYLKSHSNSRVEIAASCDSRGSNAYNLNLSLKRAKSVYNYLISKGVDKTKIAGLINLGESKLSNDCYDNKNCNEMQHQENRKAILTLILSK